MSNAQQENQKRGVKFDATINLGHILTFIGFLVTGFLAMQALSSRVVVLEEHTKTQEMRDVTQDAALASQSAHVNEALQDIKLAIRRLDDKLDSQKGWEKR